MLNEVLFCEVVRGSGGTAPHILNLSTVSENSWFLITSLLNKQPLVPIGYKSGCVPEPIWTLWQKPLLLLLLATEPIVWPTINCSANWAILSAKLYCIQVLLNIILPFFIKLKCGIFSFGRHSLLHISSELKISHTFISSQLEAWSLQLKYSLQFKTW